MTPNDIAIIELSTGFRYNAGGGGGGTPYGDPRDADRYAQRASVSYVTGSHAFKVGFQLEQGLQDFTAWRNGDLTYQFNRGVPSGVIQYAAPDEPPSGRTTLRVMAKGRGRNSTS